jgi:uncharacterized membrane protein
VSKRVEFIDLLRGWAVIVMIETHVVNATLSRDLTQTDFFQIVKFLNGLVAPSFLFASGFAYAVTTRRKLTDYLSFGKPLFRQFGRLLFILAIGYLLHLPKFKYEHLIALTSEHDWQVFWQADVLQCIAVNLIFSQLLLLTLRTERRLYAALSVLTLLILLATPVMWGIDFWNYLPVPFAAYMNGLHFSLFPLFPWSVFLFGGAIAGYMYLEAKDNKLNISWLKGDGAFAKSLLWLGPAVIVLSFVVEPFLSRLYPTYDYWRYSPSFVLLRLGIVMLLLSAMYSFEKLKGVGPGSIVTLVGRESLIVYSTHLLFIYGDFGEFNFVKRVNHSFGFIEAIITTIVLLALMYGLARVWERVKKGGPRLKTSVQLATLLIFLGVFFFGPGQ